MWVPDAIIFSSGKRSCPNTRCGSHVRCSRPPRFATCGPRGATCAGAPGRFRLPLGSRRIERREDLSMKRTRQAIISAVAATGLLALLGAQSPGDALEQGFKSPPDAAKPRTWWHWTNGNITKEGITKDLEWMKRAGIGGMQLADVASGSGQTVEKKILFGSPEWLDAVRHAASEADRLGLEMTIFSSAGWSETGGPWVKPEQAMKKLVWSETAVEGPRNFDSRLAPHQFLHRLLGFDPRSARLAPAGGAEDRHLQPQPVRLAGRVPDGDRKSVV